MVQDSLSLVHTYSSVCPLDPIKVPCLMHFGVWFQLTFFSSYVRSGLFFFFFFLKLGLFLSTDVMLDVFGQWMSMNNLGRLLIEGSKYQNTSLALKRPQFESQSTSDMLYSTKQVFIWHLFCDQLAHVVTCALWSEGWDIFECVSIWNPTELGFWIGV